MLSSINSNNIDILMISETKLNNSFPQNQFVLEGFNQPYRLDRDSNGGGILVFICNDIPSKLITNIQPSESTTAIGNCRHRCRRCLIS